jgi:hypothetical protein
MQKILHKGLFRVLALHVGIYPRSHIKVALRFFICMGTLLNLMLIGKVEKRPQITLTKNSFPYHRDSMNHPHYTYYKHCVKTNIK